MTPTENTVIPFRQEDFSEDELHRVRRVSLPLRWLVQMLYGRRNGTRDQVEVAELDLPDGYKVCGAWIRPGGFQLDVYVTHPSFPPTSIHEDVPDWTGGSPVHYVAYPVDREWLESQARRTEGAVGPDAVR